MQQSLVQSLSQLLQEARRLAQSGRTAEAKALLTRVLQIEPRQPDALQLMGLIARREGQLAAALAWFNQSLAANHAQPNAHNNLGNVLKALNRLEEAIQAYREAVRQKPDYVDAWINLGLALAAVDKHEMAVKAYSQALFRQPSNARALNALGSSQRALGQHEKAVTTLSKAVKAASNSVKALNNCANALQDTGRYEEAAALFERALTQAPGQANLMIGLSSTYFALARFQEAERLLEQVIAQDPAHLEAHRSLKTLRFVNGRDEQVVRSYEEALQARPDSGALWVNYSQALYQLGKWQAALEATYSGERHCGLLRSLALERGHILAEMGRPEEAIDLFKTLAGEDSDLGSRLTVEWVRAYLRLGDFNACHQVLRQILARNPDDFSAWAYLGLVWRLTDDARAYWLIDYDLFVRPMEVPLPKGFRRHEDFNAALSEELTRLHTTSVHPIDQTLRGGTQTFGALFRLPSPIIQQLRAAIEETIRSYMADLPKNPQHPFLKKRPENVRFAGSWSVRLNRLGYHIDHIHPRGWLSSAYYVSLPPRVVAGESQQGALRFGVSPVPVPVDHGPAKIIQPAVGTLALFPSITWHGTVPFNDDHPRLTVAFDVEKAR